MFVHICLPVHNEGQILEKNVLKLHAYLSAQKMPFDWQVAILDNASADGSRQIIEKLVRDSRGRISADYTDKPGKGEAIKKFWSQSRADLLVYMDIDLAVSLDDIPGLLRALTDEGYDLAIGSRMLAESAIKRSFIRELSSQGYNLLSRLVLGHRFSDLQCGFKAMTKKAAAGVLPRVKNGQWFFDTELIAYADKAGLKIKEMPVNWEENRYDKRKSKIKLYKDSFLFLLNLIRLKLDISR